ncbi:MAG: aminoglycoside phosphotransferase family protein [Gammaproteobacteria bacterium]|nr:aminoglycoside phosphotransferase family protein [Gammaproteobacteria bacterium]
MLLSKGIEENLRFLLVEVGGQLDHLADFLRQQQPHAAQQVVQRAGYAQNLKQRIQRACLQQLSYAQEHEADALQLSAMEDIAGELDRITALCRDCIGQFAELEATDALELSRHAKQLRVIAKGLALLGASPQAKDTRLALRLAEVDSKIKRRCRKLRRSYSDQLKACGKTAQLIAGLFITHDIEQMGDCLRGISEAILSSALGQPMSLDRFNNLQASVARLDTARPLDDLQLQPLADSRSGGAISAISAGGDEGYLAIYKDGERRKLKEERQGVESWHEIYPGVAPRIIDYHKRGKSAALLIEHLAGMTIERILLQESDALLAEAMEQLSKTLLSVWRETLSPQPAEAHFIHQMGQRMGQVYGVHPGFVQGESRICGLPQPSLDRLLKQAADYEAGLKAPFSVYIHGDFNIDNIIYDPDRRQIRFIDLHRSCYMDYVQDVSVFMVSNYRLQILDAPLRRRIMATALDLYRTAAGFAAQQGDLGFELRLALGLARSFVTSTRFVLDEALASSMFLRGRYLIEQVLRVDPHRAQGYRIPLQEIFVA